MMRHLHAWNQGIAAFVLIASVTVGPGLAVGQENAAPCVEPCPDGVVAARGADVWSTGYWVLGPLVATLFSVAGALGGYFALPAVADGRSEEIGLLSGYVVGSSLGAWGTGEVVGLDGSLLLTLAGSAVGATTVVLVASSSEDTTATGASLALAALCPVVAYGLSASFGSRETVSLLPVVIPVDGGAVFGLNTGGF